jgi:hypothetical protein
MQLKNLCSLDRIQILPCDSHTVGTYVEYLPRLKLWTNILVFRNQKVRRGDGLGKKNTHAGTRADCILSDMKLYCTTHYYVQLERLFHQPKSYHS